MTAQRIYVIGAGEMGRRHAAAAGSLPDRDVELFAADPDPDAREAFRAEYPGATVAEDAGAVLDDEPREDDVVVVATPPFTHHDLATTALERGRNVLCEKPLATTADEAAAMVALAEERDLLFASCSCRFLGYPPTERVAALVEDGTLGDVYHVTWIDREQRSRSGIEYQPESRWFLDRERSGGGILVNWGEYDVAVLNDVLATAAVTVRDAWTARPAAAADLPEEVAHDVEHHVGAALSMRTEAGRPVPVTYERAECTHGAARSTFEVEGTEGAVRWEWKPYAGEPTVEHSHDDDGTVRTEVERFDDDSPGIHERPLRYFLRELDGEAAPIRTGRDALFDHRCLRAIYETADTGTPTTVDGPE